MNATLNDWTALIGRILLAVLYLNTAISWIPNMPTAAAAGVGVPLPEIAVPLAFAFMVAGGLSLVLGFYMRWGALALALFTFLALAFFHRYWEKPAAAAGGDKVHFFKDLALVGALLFMSAFGPGRLSLDARLRK
jgi:putative oxidoreductase